LGYQELEFVVSIHDVTRLFSGLRGQAGQRYEEALRLRIIEPRDIELAVERLKRRAGDRTAVRLALGDSPLSRKLMPDLEVQLDAPGGNPNILSPRFVVPVTPKQPTDEVLEQVARSMRDRSL
jgi:hypothetical protein